MRILSSYKSVPFGELRYCYEKGICYQADRTDVIEYDSEYFQHYVDYIGTPMNNELNHFRTTLTQKYCRSLLDIGVGAGEFIKKSSIPVKGFDINPMGIRWLKRRRLYLEPSQIGNDINGVTLWDSLEHLPDPNSEVLQYVKHGSFVFVSLPIFENILWLRKSKHWKPREHLQYFSSSGLITYMEDSGFDLIEISDKETMLGREDILTFVFRKHYNV